MSTYRVIRMYFNSEDALNGTVVKRGLTLAEAKAHCQDPETSSSTATSPEMVEHTEKHGPWFDGFQEER